MKALGLPVSENKNFEVCIFCSYVPTCAPRASFDPMGIICTNLLEVHKEMLHTTYQSSTPSRFREEEFYRWASLFLCDNLFPQAGPVLTPGALYEQTRYRSTRRCYMPNIKDLGLAV